MIELPKRIEKKPFVNQIKGLEHLFLRFGICQINFKLLFTILLVYKNMTMKLKKNLIVLSQSIKNVENRIVLNAKQAVMHKWNKIVILNDGNVVFVVLYFVQRFV